MKYVVKHLGMLLGAIAALYGVALGVTLLLVPNPRLEGGLDTRAAGHTLFMTEPKYMFLNRQRLTGAERKMIVVGASNAAGGFPQKTLATMIPDAVVHNLSIPGANMTEIRESVDLIRDVQSAKARRNTNYVIGIWYGVFADDSVKWSTPDRHAGDTDLDIEAYRYGFYRRTPAGPVPSLPTEYLDLGVTMIHPLLSLDYAARQSNKVLEALGLKHEKKEHLTDADRNATIVDELQRQIYLKFWADTIQLPHLSDSSFQALAQTISEIVADGGQVTVVNMAIPRWHAERSPYEAEYEQKRDLVMAAFAGHPQVSYLELRGLDGDDDFFDEVHPKPRVVPEWCGQLAATVADRMTRDTVSGLTAKRD